MTTTPNAEMKIGSDTLGAPYTKKGLTIPVLWSPETLLENHGHRFVILESVQYGTREGYGEDWLCTIYVKNQEDAEKLLNFRGKHGTSSRFSILKQEEHSPIILIGQGSSAWVFDDILCALGMMDIAELKA